MLKLSAIPVLLISVILFGCGSASDSKVSPREAILNMYSAAEEGNWEKVCSNISESDLFYAKGDCPKEFRHINKSLVKDYNMSYSELISKSKVGEEKIDGDTAVVQVKEYDLIQKKLSPERFKLQKEAGVWKVTR